MQNQIQISLKTAKRLSRINRSLAARISRVEERIRKLQNARLLSGGVFVLALFFAAIRPGLLIPAPAALIFAPVFAILVVRTRRWSAFLAKLKRLREFNARQEARASGREPLLPILPFSHESFGSDLDFFGPYSLWTLLDETLTDEGSAELKRWITQAPLAADAILARQNQIKSLRADAWFYARLGLSADRKELKASSGQVLELLTRATAPKWLPSMFYTSVTLWILWMVSLLTIPSAAPAAILQPILALVFLIVHLNSVFKLKELFLQSVGISHHLNILTPLFSAIEKRTLVSDPLKKLAPTTATSGPARISKSLNFAASLLGTVTNPLLHIILNSAIPWTVTAAMLFERQRRRLDVSFATSLKELAHLEAVFSLVIFDRFQTQSYPSLKHEHIRTTQMFHPLVAREKVIANDFAFAPGKTLGLLTGSNMSGKSTFLRTIGLNQELANIGAPVFAASFETRPLLIETCIEVSDSLRDGFSYFYAEVRRLKALLDSAQKENVLFLIDEIFRGTNNRERQIGSLAVIRALAKSSNSQGFISTHDLELTALEKTEAAVVNLHFREHVTDGRMAFTYLLQLGASPTTNALRIMQIEGLPVDASAGSI